MGYRIEPYTEEWEAAVGRFNARLGASGLAPFLMPDRAATTPPAAVPREYYVVLDDGGEVRGGCLLQRHRAWVGGETAPAVNVQSPLSEGLADRRHVGVGPWLVRELARRHPYAYSVGMGGPQSPYPRLVRSLGWRVDAIPFFFRVLAGRRFLAHMRPLREHPKYGWAARAGGFVPVLPGLAFWMLHRSRRQGQAAEAPAGAKAEWEAIRSRYAFAIERDAGSLDVFYPPSDSQFRRVRVAGGLAVLRIGRFTKHAYFGGMTVATLAEAITVPAAARGLLAASVAEARRAGADLLITNQSAPELVEALGAEGWMSHESNYATALSPALAARIGDKPYYINRGDGDGLLNL